MDVLYGCMDSYYRATSDVFAVETSELRCSDLFSTTI